jgi:hypothetical protein
MATLGMRANNDPSEGTFATFTDILCGAGRINLSSASGIGQMRYNKDMVRCHEQFVTGRRAKSAPEKIKLGTFHLLQVELQDSLLSMCKKGSHRARKEFDNALQRQRQRKAEKAKLIAEEKLEKAEEKYIDACYYFQQFNSPRCWSTIPKAQNEYKKLTTKKDKLYYVKEQIKICHLGLGWEKAHHPWSSKGCNYEPDELFAHLVGTVIPLQWTEPIPTQPPIELPTRKNDSISLGTKSAALLELEEKRKEIAESVRSKAMKKKEGREEDGVGDQLMEMQESSWPVDKILKGGFKIDMCFHCVDGTLQWYRGVVQSVVRDKSKTKNTIEVMIHWDEEQIDEGQLNPTKQILTKKLYNPLVHVNGCWREDLTHLISE